MDNKLRVKISNDLLKRVITVDIDKGYHTTHYSQVEKIIFRVKYLRSLKLQVI